MIKLLHTLFLSSILIICNDAISQIVTTDNFLNYTTADGLITNEIKDILIQDSSNVWIGTPSGLSHFDGTTFTSYTAANSGLNNDNIKELEFSQNKIWMVTDSGLTGFDGTVFENYTPGNGLLSYSINGITTTGNDTLWIVSDLGASKFDGNTFVDYSGQGGKDIETDSLDRVYVLRYSFAVDRFPFTRVYENGVWSLPVSTGLSIVYNNAKFIKTETNNLFLTSTSGNFAYFFKINYPANCIKQSLYVDNSPYDRFSTNSLIDLSHFEESDNYRWFGAGFNSSFYHVSSDSNYYSQYINNTIAKSSCIHLKNSILAIGSDSGIYFTTPTLKSTTNRLEFAVNTIRTSVEITDPLFSNLAKYPNSRPGFEFPKDSNSYGIYSANFIVAAKKSSQSNFKVYPLRGFAQAFSPGPITSSGGLANGYLVSVLKQEIINHKLNFNSSGYSTPRGIKDWPAYGDPIAGISIDLAPFFDFNNDGGYNPQDGDYPIIKGDEALYWINHPSDLNLELEYHWMMYGFNSPTLDQTIFLQYTIVNRATTVFDSLKIGLFIDADIGNARDDYMGSDSLNNLLYFYNGDQFDEDRLGLNGYGNTSPALGIKFLSDTMENSIYFTSSNLANGVPYSVQHWMNFMNSKWKDGQSIKYGGDGYQSSGASNLTTNYMYTGNPVAQTGWTEAMPGGGQASNPPGDRRLFGSMPYFSLQPNLRKTIEIAVGYGRTSDTSQIIGKNIAEMTNVLNQARAHWDTISTPTLTFATNDTSNTTTSIQNTISNQSNLFIVFPVPSSGELTVETEENMVLIEVYDMKGSQILSLSVNQKQTHISLAGYQNGFYLIRVQLQDDTWMMKKVVKM